MAVSIVQTAQTGISNTRRFLHMTKREAVIVGVADLPLKDGKVLAPMSVLQAQALVARDALKDAGIAMHEVDGLLTAGMWGVPAPGRGAGRGEGALITYGSLQKSEMSRTLAGRPAVLTMQYETPWGMPTPVGGYAMAAKRHMHEYGTTSEQLAEIAVATRKWAALNPAATMREPLSIEDVLQSTMISDPLHLLDICLVTDGGGAVVMTTAEHAKALGRKPVFVRGYGESHTHWTIAAMADLARLTAAEVAGGDAFAMAGIRHDAIDVVEVYDSFTITVLLRLEALGFCKRGEGGAFVANQRTAPGGVFPLNTNGGGLSYAHPGMYGIFLLIEAVRQLRGECGPRQIQNAVTALVHGTGGTLSSGATCILSTR